MSLKETEAWLPSKVSMPPAGVHVMLSVSTGGEASKIATSIVTLEPVVRTNGDSVRGTSLGGTE